MGGKTKKKQARKQAATQTKRNGGRNGVSGHMKKSTMGGAKRASEHGDNAPQLQAKKSSKNAKNQMSSNMKRKRGAEENNEDDDDDSDNIRDLQDNSDLELHSLPTNNGNVVSSDIPSAKLDLERNRVVSSKKKRKLNTEKNSECATTSASLYIHLRSIQLVQLDASSFSRLLYPNPVCFLTTINPKDAIKNPAVNAGLNVMTLSWMTPVNNYGGFAFAIHKTRFSSVNLLEGKKFTLSVPTAQSRDLVISVGRVSGKVVQKFDGSIPNLQAGKFGLLGMANANNNQNEMNQKKNGNGFDALMDSDDEGDEADDEALTARSGEVDIDKVDSSTYVHPTYPAPIDGTVAHMHCTMISVTDAADAGTYLVVAKIMQAAVHPEYWSSKGKCFVTAGPVSVATPTAAPTVTPAPAAISNSEIALSGEPVNDTPPPALTLPPILSFLGSQRFGHLISE